jgi:transposase, IS6 family
MRHSAKRFFSKALAAPHTSKPRVITVDKNAAYPKAWKRAESGRDHPCLVRTTTEYIPQQSYRARPSLLETAGQARDGLLFVRDRVANPCRGYEAMNMIRKGQMHGVDKGDILNQLTFIAGLFGVAS